MIRNVIHLDTRRPEPKRKKRWKDKDEEIEADFYQLPYPSLNLPGGNRWVRPLPTGAMWPED